MCLISAFLCVRTVCVVVLIISRVGILLYLSSTLYFVGSVFNIREAIGASLVL